MTNRDFPRSFIKRKEATPMQTFESTLGTATLMLASTALVLGITILIL